MSALGLQTYIWNNNIRSVLLLLGFPVLLLGMVFCLTLWRTGSLWWALGFHAAWDWAQSFVFGVADSGTMVEFHLMGTHPVGKVLLSGGATGPEGSELILVVLALVTGVVVWTLRVSGDRSM